MDNASLPSRRRFLAAASRVAAVAVALQTFGPAHAFDENSVSEVNVDAKGLALHGYDPVAYFNQSGPVRGQERYTAQYGGATYRFAMRRTATPSLPIPPSSLPHTAASVRWALR